MITSAEEARKVMGNPWGNSTKQLQKIMENHLKEWRPKEYQRLKGENRLKERTLRAAKKVQAGLREAKENDLDLNEEENRLMRQHILLAPEKEVMEEMEDPEH